MFESLRVKNLLSFGSENETLDLKPLNVFIGPNGSGKSNFISCLQVLHWAARDLSGAFNGGMLDWLHKPHKQPPVASIEAVVKHRTQQSIRHSLTFTSEGGLFKLLDERIENREALGDHENPYLYFGYRGGQPYLNVSAEERQLKKEYIERNRSILSQRRDPELYPELTTLAQIYNAMHFYDVWYSAPRGMQKADLPHWSVSSNAENLALVLSSLLLNPEVREKLESRLGDYFSSFRRLHVNTQNGLCQIYIEQQSGAVISSNRLSDGTLRFMVLLAILLHPDPPPLVCIEEPEVCQHPDVLPILAELLVEASQRSQIVVTTHSVGLVDGLSEMPDSVIVCEQEKGCSFSTMSRLQSDELKFWLEDYTLGTLWTKGEIGGNRW